MINIISVTDISQHLSALAKTLPGRVPSLKSFYATAGNRARLLYGKSYIEDRLAGLTLRAYPLTFVQPNPKTAEELYRAIVSLVPIGGDERLLGLYCGAGAVELFMSRYVKEVTGVDASGPNVAVAKENAAINGIANATFIKGKVEQSSRRLSGAAADLVIVDPPRAGLSNEALTAVLHTRAHKLCYISCNPSTLARDLKYLRAAYEVKHIVPFDFFPHTTHFEVLTIMQRKEGKTMLNVKC
jgi:23S rRNA (uracil1939-C5)-methyltransferase